MLKNYLTTLPFTKFVLIEDSLEERGQPIFDFLIRSHLDKLQNNVQFFTFHGSFNRAQKRFENKRNIVVHDFTTNVCGWNLDKNKDSFEEVASRLSANDIVIVDSLAHAIFQYGLVGTYKIFNTLRNQNILQVITMLHTDLLDDKNKVNKIFEHLCTLSLVVEPKFISENGRVQYTFKKLGGKVIKQIEEYSFVGEDLITKKIDKIDPKKLLEKSTPPEINPETLSTFKIGLSDKEKASRDQVVLPYLPKNENGEDGGKIIYELDAVDDWDEEDPDDDLDI
ncbi:elongator complex protein 5 [Anoplophora glabripennis]|uniref:elongator complex protein 5 n=1 Tax=Anoplophora glabripennis TaxID=217634 RepID=UPI000874F00E|nr:elongator complex protein 5 [Anoplophora glabripennis]